MSIQSATPYLVLCGKAEAAIALYTRALGATVNELKRFGDMDQSCAAAQKDLVMHAELKLGNGLLMLSDGPGETPGQGLGHMSIALNFNDEAEAKRCFAGLGETGKIVQPLIAAPWGALFGIVHDEFGFSWMFNCETKR